MRRVNCLLLVALAMPAVHAQSPDSSASPGPEKPWRVRADAGFVLTPSASPRIGGLSVAVRVGRGALEGGVGFVSVYQFCPLLATQCDQIGGIGAFVGVRDDGPGVQVSGGIGAVRYQETLGATQVSGVAPTVRGVLAFQKPGQLGMHVQLVAVATRRRSYPMVGAGFTF